MGDNTQPAGGTVTWTPLIDGWINHLTAAGHAPSTRRTRRAAVTVIANAANPHPPRDLKPAWLIGWCATQPWSTDHRRTIRTSLRSFYQWCIANGHAEVNIGDCLPAVPESTPKPRPVTDAVYAQLLGAAPPHVAVMARLAAEAGLRRAEVAALHSRDLTADAGGPLLLVTGKGSRQRAIPITDSLADALHTHLSGRTGWVFPGDDNGHASPNWVGKQVSALLPPGWSMHKLRHRFASKGYAGTKDLVAVRAALGHASLATTQRYVAVGEDAVRRVAEAAA